jgi:hypothetical protein
VFAAAPQAVRATAQASVAIILNTDFMVSL